MHGPVVPCSAAGGRGQAGSTTAAAEGSNHYTNAPNGNAEVRVRRRASATVQVLPVCTGGLAAEDSG